MKKNISLVMCFLFNISHIGAEAATSVSPVVKDLVYVSKKSSKKLPLASWPYAFEDESLYQVPETKIDKDSKADAQNRFYRMIHSNFLKPSNTKEMWERAYSISTFIPKIDSYVKLKMGIYGEIQHISIYGSFLYNMTDPDDIDMLIVVDSPSKIFKHAEVSSKTITGSQADTIPKFNFQVIDYNTYISSLAKATSSYLSRAENMALQQIAVGSAWYFTIYGYDFRFDNPRDLKDVTKLNYLKKSIVSLNAAGERLYKSAYNYLPKESERVRLRKVVSRILISDFLIPVMDKSIKATPSVYTKLYDEIRLIKDNELLKWKKLEKKINELYFKKLEELLSIAEKQGKLGEVIFKDK